MRQRMRMQYYCDFCKKSGGSKFHLLKHEKHCTGNPDRECRMCVSMNGGQLNTNKELLSIFGEGGDAGLDRLKDAAGGCPMCILATIRQSDINSIDEETGVPRHSGFVFYDFHKEKKEAFDDINEERELSRDCYS